jgi:hypothetical protein
MFLGTLANQ